MTAEFWQAVDTRSRMRCRAEDQFSCDCWQHQRAHGCLALNSQGERCNGGASSDFPFCRRHRDDAIDALLATAFCKTAWAVDPIDRLEAQVEVWYGGSEQLSANDRRRLRALGAEPTVADPRTNPPKMFPARTAVYRHFDEDAHLLYVGISSDPHARGKQHAREAGWYRFLAHTAVEWFESRIEAEWAEQRAIHEETPIFNKAGSGPDRNRRVSEYLLDAAAYDLLRPAV